MAVTKKLVTNKFEVHSADLFVKSFYATEFPNDYFMYVGNHLPYANSDSVITTPVDSVQASHIDQYDNMVFSKRITSSDVVFMVDRVDWTSGEIYSEYNHADSELQTKDFFVTVNDSTEYNVYKCLFNNANTASTVAPSRAGTSADLEPIETGDGYIWKYMYTINKVYFDKFATTSYVPVIANTSVISGATSGAIEVIKIEDGGAGYTNYIANASFGSSDIEIAGQETFYGAPDSASEIDDFYQGGVLKITSGAGSEQYRKILSYSGSGVQKYFVIDSAFTTTPAVNDTYEVYPFIHVWGDGEETTAAEGRAIINATSNSIQSIEMLNTGENYFFGQAYPSEMPSSFPITITDTLIETPTDVSLGANFEAANLTPIISPPNGHGSDPWNELDAKRVCISVKYNQSEAGTIPTENEFRTVGIIKNPLFDNVDIRLDSSNTVGSFVVGETIYQFKQQKLLGNVNVVTDNTYITKTSQGLISSVVTIENGGTGYDSTANDELVFDNSGTNGSGAAATFSNNGSGVITSITVTSQGNTYISPPTATIAGAAGGSDAVVTIELANPQLPTFQDSFSNGDFVLVQSNTANFLTVANSVPEDWRVIGTTNSAFTANNLTISAVETEASGVVVSYGSDTINISNGSGVFTEGSKVFGVTSGATGVIFTSNSSVNGLEVNDKDAEGFNTSVQLSRLVGDWGGGTEFEDDEYIEQNSLVAYAKPNAYLHHIEVNGGTDDDILHVSNLRGIFNTDSSGVRTITGNTSGATLTNLSNKYNGDFVKGSGDIIYIENLDAISRGGSKSEIIKIILEF